MNFNKISLETKNYGTFAARAFKPDCAHSSGTGVWEGEVRNLIARYTLNNPTDWSSVS
jgi:hypothetical protein